MVSIGEVLVYPVGLIAGLLVRFFSFVFAPLTNWLVQYCYSTQIVFSTAWEDPRVDQMAVLPRKDEVAMIITSAGCNALSLAIDGVSAVHCVDKNPAQNALLELKLAAIQELDYETFWKLFGEGCLENFTSTTYRLLRPRLSPDSRKFWDAHSYYFDGTGMRKSFYFHGCSGWLACVVRVYLWVIPGLYSAVMEMMEAKTMEEQVKIYRERVEKKMWNPVLMFLLSSPLTLAILNGVPKAQRDLLQNSSGSPSIAAFIKDSLEYVFTKLPVQDNYFWRVYLTGKYTHSCCPEYLTPEGFRVLKDGAVSNITVNTCYVTEFLQKHNKNDITRFYLLDHMDWLSSSPEVLGEEWEHILRCASPDGCRFLYRSACQLATFVKETEIMYRNQKRVVADVLSYKPDLSAPLHLLDRVHTYTSFHVADLVQ